MDLYDMVEENKLRQIKRQYRRGLIKDINPLFAIVVNSCLDDNKIYPFLKWLLANGGDINSSHDCLYLAIANHNIPIVKWLLKYGANPNICIPDTDEYTEEFRGKNMLEVSIIHHEFNNKCALKGNSLFYHYRDINPFIKILKPYMEKQ